MGMNDLWTNSYDSVLDGEREGMKRREIEQQYQQAQQMNPLLQEQQRGVNATREAQLPGIRGTSMSHLSRGEIDQAGTEDQIKLNRQKTLSGLDDEKLKEMQGFGDKLSVIGAELDNVPAAARPALFKQLATESGLDVSHPRFQSLLTEDPNTLPKLLQDRGKAMSFASGEFQRKRALEQSKQETQLKMNQANNDTRISAAEIAANARIEAAEKKAAQAAEKLSLEQQVSKLLRVPEAQRNAEWNKSYSDAMNSATALRSAGANNSLAPTMINGETPTTPAQRTQDVVNKVVGADGGSSFASFRKMYPPSVTDQQIRDAYKQKTGKELK